jgi:hypothetical protein
MEALYRFMVNEYSAKGSSAHITKTLIIDCFSDEMRNTSLYFHLKFDFSTNGELSLTNITLGTEIYGKEDPAKVHYLMGVFGLPDTQSVKKVLEELKNQLNGKDFEPSHSVKKWKEFSLDFINWFNSKIKPSIIKDMELHKMYF